MSSSSPKSVAIVGAGVSGLVSAVNMLKVGIRPTIFEKTSTIGGLWNTDVTPCWKSLRSIISKFVTVLPDFPWPNQPHLFPTQHEIFSYLSNYVQQSLPSDVFLFNTNVTNIRRTDGEINRWTVQYCTKNSEPTSHQYDFVIISSGFYARPHIPKDIIGLSSFPGTILHSSDYRSSEQVRGKRVIVVGGSISGTEIAADMASKADHIIHIAPHKFWPLPRLLPVVPTDPASPFLPIDFQMLRRSTRTSDKEVIFRDESDHRKLNTFFRLLIGSDQPFPHLSDSIYHKPIYANITDMYLGWYRADRISVQHGRLNKVNENGALVLDNGTMIETTCNDVLVLCTGFGPCLDFFSSDILKQLSYEPDDIFCPLILYRRVLPMNLLGLAFIGMYQGPFWMVIELQARWTAAMFSGCLPMPSVSELQAGIDIQYRIRHQQPRPQLPYSDIVGTADSLAKECLGMVPSNMTDSVLSTHYRTDGPEPTVIDEYNAIVKAANQGRFVAGVVFRALHGGKWKYERTSNGRLAADIACGEAQFKFSEEGQLLYMEVGELTNSSSTTAVESLHIAQKYMYIYDEENDSLAVYFVENDSICGSLFHRIQFEPKKSTEQAGWTAVGDHQCNDDHYSVSYLFAFSGVQLARFHITYVVNSPAKDHTSTTIFYPVDLTTVK